MFSYDGRLRALQLYIKLGKRVRLTIRQLGFPTKNTLKHWCQEYEQDLGLATGYLSPMIDCFDGMVVSWTIGTRPDAELVNMMLDAAVESVTASSERPIVHSDRGAHYRWPGWLSRIADAKLARSMSRKACSPDNAACEGFFGRLKTELFYTRSWLSTTIEEFIAALHSYILWYNADRIKISLGAHSRIEYRRKLGLAT